MKILITGATGLIGSHLVAVCQEENIDVHYLTTSREKIETKPGYIGFYWNPTKNHIDEKAFEGVSTIVHLAGASISKRWTSSYKKIILESRTKTTNLLCKTLSKIDHKVTHFISASGISIYPNSELKLYTEESTEVDNDFLGMVTVAWEAAADRIKDIGIDVAKVRTGVVFDKDDGAFLELVKPIKLGLAAPVGSGRQYLSWIHSRDLVCIYKKIINDKLEGTYNAVAPTPVNNHKLTKEIANRLHVPLWLPNVPTFVLKLMLGEMATLITEGQLVSSTKIEDQGFKFEYANIQEALDELLPQKNAT